MWDGEDKVMLFQDDVEDTVHQEHETTLWVEATFDGPDPSSFRIARVWFEGDDTIDVYVRGDPY